MSSNQDQLPTASPSCLFRPKSHVSSTTVASGKFLQLMQLQYRDGDDVRPWEAVHRVQRGGEGSHHVSTSNGPTIDAVDIIAILSSFHTSSSPSCSGHGEEESMLIVVQYRPPLQSLCLEFPAGLIDPGETPQDAAIRELREETGYVVRPEDCEELSEVLAYEPGMSNSCFHMVTARIDTSNPANRGEPKQHLDVGEDIAVYRVPHNGNMLGAMRSIQTMLLDKTGMQSVIDGKLYTYAIGLRVSSSSKNSSSPSVTHRT